MAARSCPLLLAVAVTLATAAPAQAQTVTAGTLKATISTQPFRIAFTDTSGNAVFDTIPGGSASSPTGAPAFRSLGRWAHATRATVTGSADAIQATLATDDPLGRTIRLTITPRRDGVIRVSTAGPREADAMAAAFAAIPGERFLGFGERSDQVVRTGGDVQNLVTEGPYQAAENPFITVFVPLAGYNPRADATYFPIPWLLSTRGAGLLVRDDARSVFHLGRPWSVETEGPGLTFDVYAGPTPAQALERFSADVGRQPRAAAPYYFGPWWQPAHGDADLKALQDARAEGSVVQTYTHYLPCGDQQGNESGQAGRTQKYHDAGLAITTYFNPMICTSYEPRFTQARSQGLLTKDNVGNPYVYRYTGSSTFLVGQFDFTQAATRRFYGDLLDEAVQQGYDGWMEDFGEYTPDNAYTAAGQTGSSAHNHYVVDYHRAAREYATTRSPKPLARFNRSGWTGAAEHSQIVWGGDPTTGFGFDGLASAVRNGLSMGLSGVSLWGSDIGGYFALSMPQTTPDLLRRWLQFGFASPVMRTQANGFALAPSTRAQIVDKDILPVWTRYARLRTQFYPYLKAAEEQYDRSGLPMMRQLGLIHPDDPEAVTKDDEYLLGDDLLVAPVLTGGTTKRKVYLPKGRWIDWWRSVRLDADTAPHLTAPRVLDGGREVELPAPQDELPLLIREGAVITLLPADVRTLSDYGAGNTVRLADRAGVRTVLAWPRKASGRRFVVRIKQERRRRVDLQIAVPAKPCALTLGAKKRLRFRYRAGVVTATAKLRNGTITARRRCR